MSASAGDGFGAAAHVVAQVAKWQGRTVFAFTWPGDVAAQTFARRLGATWAGAPEPLDAAIIYAAAGDLVPLALEAVGYGSPRGKRNEPPNHSR